MTHINRFQKQQNSILLEMNQMHYKIGEKKWLKGKNIKDIFLRKVSSLSKNSNKTLIHVRLPQNIVLHH